MGNFTEVEKEFNDKIAATFNAGNPMHQNPTALINSTLLNMRITSLKNLSEKTKRNVICYYSAWLQTTNGNPEVMINDNDMNGFMNAINKMDKSKGLDLILHTPGGITTATESLVNYIKKCFKNNFRVIVPHMAMSAGTMIACASKIILMGKQSSLGPIDPQYRNVPAEGVIEEFKRAFDDTVRDPNNSLIWKEIIQQYRPTFVGECENVIRLSHDLVENWLKDNMFKHYKNRDNIVKKILAELASHKNSKVHDKHYDNKSCKKLGLKIFDIENDQVLQDLILTIHHTYILSIFRDPSLIKLIESQNGQTFIMTGQRQ